MNGNELNLFLSYSHPFKTARFCGPLMAGLPGFHCNNNINNNNVSYSPENKYTRNPGNELSSQLKPMSRALWVNQVSCFVSSLQTSITSADLSPTSTCATTCTRVVKYPSCHTSPFVFHVSVSPVLASFCNPLRQHILQV